MAKRIRCVPDTALVRDDNGEIPAPLYFPQRFDHVRQEFELAPMPHVSAHDARVDDAITVEKDGPFGAGSGFRGPGFEERGSGEFLDFTNVNNTFGASSIYRGRSENVVYL